MTTSHLEIHLFESATSLETWLEKNHQTSKGLWLKIAKKDSGENSVTYAEALDVALCYGWIDGQKQKHDEKFWLQKFTPRRSKSGWSKVNTQHVDRLIKAGKVKPAGFLEIEAAKADGRWEKAYDSPSNSVVPEDFLDQLSKNAKAKLFFGTLNKANIYAITYRLQTAKKQKTREKRLKIIIEMLEKGEKFHF